MKFPLVSLSAVAVALLWSAGCAHVDVTPEASRTRVLRGTLQVGQALPAGTEILVRVVAPAGGMTMAAPGGDIPVVRQVATSGERILGEFVRTLQAPVDDGMPFAIEFDAEDALLRRGVNLDARVYFNGRVRFRTVNAHAVTASSVQFPQALALQAVER